MATEANTQSFWEHLDVLRAAIIKIVAVAVVFGIVVFFFKEQLFGVLLPISCSTGWLHGQEVQWNHFPFDLLIQG